MSIQVCSSSNTNCVPRQVTQGEIKSWTASYSDYPATLYTLVYRFRGNGIGIDVTATADGDDYEAEITAEQSATLTPAAYNWQAWLTEIADTDNTFLAESGTLKVEVGFAAEDVAAVDLRSQAQIMLDMIDAALLAFATSDVTEYEYETPAGRRKVKRSDKAGLHSQRKYWATHVSVERTKKRVQNGGALMRSVGIVVRER